MKVFGYGSLMNVASGGRALGREIVATDFTLASLRDYKRTWSLMEQVFSNNLGEQVDVAFLDIQYALGSIINGVLISVNEVEIERLRAREKNYTILNVTDNIELFDKDIGTEEVITFISKETHRIPEGEEVNIFVLRRYVDMITFACKSLGEKFLLEYEETTEPIPFKILEGKYTFTDVEQMKNA